jgi:hypothetical protein
MGMKKNVPTVVTAKGKLCPVCGQTSYSPGGVHPQCSFFRADQKLLEVRRRDRAAAALLEGKT